MKDQLNFQTFWQQWLSEALRCGNSSSSSACRHFSILSFVLYCLYLEKKKSQAFVNVAVDQQQCDFHTKVYNCTANLRLVTIPVECRRRRWYQSCVQDPCVIYWWTIGKTFFSLHQKVVLEILKKKKI